MSPAPGTSTSNAPRHTRGHARAAVSASAALAISLGLTGLAGGAVTSASASAVRFTPATHLKAGVMPKTAVGSSALRTASAPAGAHLTYYGGKVIPNVQVTQVLYGSGTYTSEVSSTSQSSGQTIAQFYAGVTNSTYFDWLTEYNTVGLNGQDGQPGSNQSIGRGSFASQATITPSSANNGATVDDTQIQAELHSQILAGHLAAPTANTLYAVYFPANKTITQGGSSSGVQFCAYHGTVPASGGVPEFYYSVLPDFTTGGMTSGCGSGTRFQNETSVSSHEMVEATTDAEVGIGNTVARPLAWYDSTNGEIGDICNAQQATVAGGNGFTYTVQREFSNRQNNCVVSGPAAGNDFSISAAPSSGSVAAGSGTTSTISTAVTSGSAGTVSLAASGAPAGVTATLNPASVTAGASSTLTLSTTSAATAGTYTLTVTGTEGSATHTASYSLTVTGSGAGGGGSGITNGGFETGTLSGWASSGSTSVVSSGAQGGTYAARVGSTSPSTDSSIAQAFTAPAGSTGISFYYDVFCPDTVSYDWATATLKDNTAGTTATLLPKTCTNPSSGWKQVTGTVTAGHSYTLTLASHDDNYAGDPTYTLYDTVSLTTTAPPPPPPSGISNGGFETGTFSGWSPSGAHTAISGTAHTGAHSGEGGNTTATNGDSNIVQTFTAPTGTSTLSAWYESKCPDTVTYDWTTITLKDNTAGTTATLLPKTCAATLTWSQVSGAVTPGHSYTLTLTNHDDNYASDPTYSLFDDIALS